MAAPLPLLLTRPQAQSADFAAALEAAAPGRFAPVIAPLLRIAPLPGALPLDGAQGLIFTSANGVAQFAARASGGTLPAYCVGEMTAEAARRAGLEAHSADGDVVALEALIRARHHPGAGHLVHVRGRHAAGDLVSRLKAAGVPAQTAEIYDQIPCPLAPEAAGVLASRQPAVLALFSPRSAALFTAEAEQGAWDLGALTAVSLSPAADTALVVSPGARRVCAAPTRAAMLAALAAL